MTASTDIRALLRSLPAFPEDLSQIPDCSFQVTPLEAVERWLVDAVQEGIRFPHLLHLATAGLTTPDASKPTVRPATRVLSCKDIDSEAVYFATRSGSRKVRDIEVSSTAAAHFYWPELGRQIRIEGEILLADAQTIEADFKARSATSQIAAAVANQVPPGTTREALVAQIDAAVDAHTDLPSATENWRVFGIHPIAVEFWQARHDRVHERVVATHDGTSWSSSPAAP